VLACEVGEARPMLEFTEAGAAFAGFSEPSCLVRNPAHVAGAAPARF
jgi:hypothetical protein